MAVTSTIEFEIPPALQRALKTGDFAVKPAMEFISRSTLQLMSKAIENAPVGVSGGGGGLRGSISSHFEDNGLTGIVGSDLSYAPYVEQGTRPHWPPFGAGSSLARWARAKGIPAFLVARRIAQRGTPAQKFMERAANDIRDNVIPAEISRLGNAISGAWGRIR